jgi:hypothetical protein
MVISNLVKTHKYINRQNQSTTGNCENRNDPDLIQAFPKKWFVASYFKAPDLPPSLRLKVIFRYQDLFEIYSVSANTIISHGFSYSENV